MRVREIISIFLEELSGGIPSDDTNVRPRRIYSLAKAARAKILGDAMKNGKTVSESNYTTIPCIPVVEVTANECGCIPKVGCKYYKADCPLPQITAAGDNLLSDITTMDGTVRFSKINWDQIKYTQYDKYTSDDPKYYVKNGVIYLLHVPKGLQVITARAILDDPTEITEACYYCPTTLDTCGSKLDQDFSLDRKYMPQLFQLMRFMLINQNQDVEGDLQTRNERYVPTVQGTGG